MNPWSDYQYSQNWKFDKIKREIDVVIGLRVMIEKQKTVIPLIAIELKSSLYLSTDELDKKSAIYGPLREIYPWVTTIFIHKDMDERNMNDKFLFRNARQFDKIITEGNKQGKELLRKVIDVELEYIIDYWAF